MGSGGEAAVAAAVKDAVAYLQKTKTTNGENVFDHLSNVLLKVLEERPASAVDLLETSLRCKKTGCRPTGVASASAGPDHTARDATRAVARNDLFRSPAEAAEESAEESSSEPPNECEVVGEDCCSGPMAYAFDAAGIAGGLGRSEAIAIAAAMSRLARDPAKKLATVRFFGKFFAIRSVYYVYESTMKEPSAAAEDNTWGRPTGGAPAEEEGSGSNTHTYWTCAFLGGPFTRLPNITPLQITTARQLKRVLTGDLQAELPGFPSFPGTEVHFLRAQIARIAAATTLCATSYFTTAEEGEGLVQNAEWAFPDTLPGMDGWAHRRVKLLRQGRETAWEASEEGEGAEGGEGGEKKAAVDGEPEEAAEPLSTLDKDAPLDEGGDPAWSLHTATSLPGLLNKVWAARSLAWPGACAVMTPQGFANVYVGWGVKHQEYTPAPPPPVQEEYAGPMVELTDLPPPPPPPPAPEEEAQGEEEGGEGADGEGEGEEAAE